MTAPIKTIKRPPTRESVLALMLHEHRTTNLWLSMTRCANRFGCDRSVITRFLGELGDAGRIPTWAERYAQNNTVTSMRSMRTWRIRKKAKKPVFLTDSELAERYAGRRYTDVRFKV